MQDTDTGAEIARVPCAGDMDDLCYDPARRRLHVISAHGGGTVTTIDLTSRENFVRLAAATQAGTQAAAPTVQTSIGARTGCWDSGRDSLYVACPATAKTPARLLVYHAS